MTKNGGSVDSVDYYLGNKFLIRTILYRLTGVSIDLVRKLNLGLLFEI